MIHIQTKAKIKALVLDASGTLFDVVSIQTLTENQYLGQGPQIAVFRRDKQIEHARIITQPGPVHRNAVA